MLVSAQELSDPANQRQGERGSGGGTQSHMSSHSMAPHGFHTTVAMSDARVTSHAAAAVAVVPATGGQLGKLGM